MKKRFVVNHHQRAGESFTSRSYERKGLSFVVYWLPFEDGSRGNENFTAYQQQQAIVGVDMAHIRNRETDVSSERAG